MPLRSAPFVAKHSTMPGRSVRAKRSRYCASNARISPFAVRSSTKGRLVDDGAARRRSCAISADILTPVRLNLLIHELQRKLHLSRNLRRKNMVEGGRTYVAVWQSEVRAVQDVEQLRAELELRRLCHLEILKAGKVPVSIGRAGIHIAAFRAKLTRIGCGIEPVESAGIEPLVNRAWPVIGVADEIGPLRGESGDLRRTALRCNVVRIEDRERCAAHQGSYAIQLPSAERPLIPVLGMVPERKRP